MYQGRRLPTNPRKMENWRKKLFQQSTRDYGWMRKTTMNPSPRLELNMPIYLGATRENMANGAAVMGQTSLPIGGSDTNCVLAGHRGWNGAAYFLYINQLEPRDTVTVTNLWETLTYTVTETKIINPNDVDAIHIQPGKELLTLLTCHPPASGGKQRYLVFCERTNP